ncbi:ADI_G0001050.mRNA.1.CDS.1 [Saccharomyces cerevisiae]|nr:ATM_1a_G0000870.mRNA.1.CDS.1 [Saccharomyces cerevisiae]CAI4247984.1 ADI_G0001050.mRNA.1.CDS.1 [Saccharomyces cerevisiae]CAI4441848.1 AIE_G0016720.mRNA.1.CDS.1 [Saccharomyces cerevisiae]CAI4518017.1 BLD_1a_G0025390.mRNA.1.CDS.1 [Saccharomyces cerevisiae]CAI6475367.1 ADI_G0001050.mRNA.1.CDS.1 [Saccharomyces cerevisiae]
MLAKTGDVVVQKVPVIRLSVFSSFFFCFSLLSFAPLIYGYETSSRIYNGTQRFSLCSSSDIARFLRKRWKDIL